ncbi:hypothetical protein DIZ27_14380 [Streptomyces sp. NWU339]|uniref:hypothetical protein n=1 Tax=Streptomyces sp. NWU339 TaxID=2185284 RepID=UPI000D67AFC9|nr:hypothetical protein [Streptomyces sp. NWU339]PWI09726.1 hypothetical protein DIZ27_14380 [Streptomyces sp. NWU339]
MAAATAALCRTVESVLVATLPAIFVLPLISGVYIPREVLPDALGEALLFAPLSSTIDLMRSGWTGELSAGGVLTRSALAIAWTGFFARIAAAASGGSRAPEERPAAPRRRPRAPLNAVFLGEGAGIQSGSVRGAGCGAACRSPVRPH